MILWTHHLAAAAGGLAVARETGHVFVWDARPWLVLLNHRGELQGQVRHDAPVVAGAVAEDGSALAVAAARPLLHLACPSSSARLFAAADFGFVGAVDPFGRWLWQDMPVVHVGS